MKKQMFTLGFIAIFIFTIFSLAFVLSGCSKSSSQWDLKEITDRETQIYEGDVEVHGYMELATYYADEKRLMLRVLDKDLKKFPTDKFKNFVLEFEGKDIIENPEILARLNDNNAETPAVLKVDTLSYPMEGSPILNLVEVLE